MKANVVLAVLTLVITIVTPVNLYSIENKSSESLQKSKIRFEAAWKASISNDHYASETDNSNNVGFRFTSKVNATLSPKLTAFLKAKVKWKTGRSQRAINSGNSKSGIDVDEVFLKLTPKEYLSFKAGAIDQGHIESPLLISSRSFPGALEELSFKLKIFTFGVRAGQTIPTSTSYDTVRIEKEKTPNFFTETLFFNSNYFKRVSISSSVTRYRYKNLPSVVANKSAFMGNSVFQTESETDSRFAFQFAGTSALIKFEVTLFKNSVFTIGFQHVENDKAPDAYNRGRRLFTEFKIPLKTDTITTKYEIFFNESDTSPGYYNSSKYAHNNREGYMVGLDYDFNKYGYSTSIQYVDSDIIQANLYDQHEQSISVNLETTYASF